MNEMTMISDPTDQAIEVKSLTKQFGRFTAVDDLSFTVKTGEAVALWGPTEPVRQRLFAAC